MRRLLLFLTALFLLVPTYAQNVPNKPMDLTLREYTIEEVIHMFGKPVQIDSGLIDGGLAVEYPKVDFYYFASGGDPEGPPLEYVPDGFAIKSRDFCIFSKYFEGGIRVGDTVERVQNLDIVHTKVGKGREKNALRLIADNKDGQQYLLLGEEYWSYFLNAKNGIIEEIFTHTPEDIDRLWGGMLWKITLEGNPEPSYVLGTFPGASASLLRRIDGLEKAWQSVKTVYFQDPDTGPWSRKLTDERYLPDGKELSDLYKWEDYAAIQDYVKTVTGFRPESLEWTPDGLTCILLNHLLDQALPELADVEEDMYSHLLTKAQSEGKGIHMMQSQFRNYFADKDQDTAEHHTRNLLRMVRETETEPEQLKARIRHLYEAYLAQDLEELNYSLMNNDYSLENPKCYSPFQTLLSCMVNPWIDDVCEAATKGPILVVVDFTSLNLGDLLGRLMYYGTHWNQVESVKPFESVY